MRLGGLDLKHFSGDDIREKDEEEREEVEEMARGIIGIGAGGGRKEKG